MRTTVQTATSTRRPVGATPGRIQGSRWVKRRIARRSCRSDDARSDELDVGGHEKMKLAVEAAKLATDAADQRRHQITRLASIVATAVSTSFETNSQVWRR
jgi:hypothetical protein